MFLLDLPTDLILLVLEQLDYVSLIKGRQVSAAPLTPFLFLY